MINCLKTYLGGDQAKKEHIITNIRFSEKVTELGISYLRYEEFKQTFEIIFKQTGSWDQEFSFLKK